MVSQTVGNTNIRIEYERPAVRGRVIFGELVPYGQVWRTGAGRCTRISFDRPVKIEGQSVAAGVYALFSIPRQDTWTLILNADTSLYGSYNYDETKDVLRLQVKPSFAGRHYEAFTIDIDFIPNNARIYVSWDRVQVIFDITTSTDEAVITYIKDTLLSGVGVDPDEYALAADYLMYQNVDIPDVILLTHKAIELGGGLFPRRVQMEAHERLSQVAEAIKRVKETMQYVEKLEYDKKEDKDRDRMHWRQHLERLSGQ
ncbi:MAG: DUF2911 domain-containing protein [Saprospiraceae bacterium]|nr:DUF2911 domain-containing protein [Saprospiraceae bacterium]